MSEGRVYLVGAGPGDPGLLTVRGRDLLARADVVVVDHLACPRLLALAPASAERIYVGKQAADHTLTQEQINALLVRLGREGKQVVRLKGGDPYVFGRGGEEGLALAAAGVAFEVVPGVTAGIAAAAYAGIPVTHRTVASNVGFITGHETPGKDGSDLDYQALADWRGTLVFYMGVRNVGAICQGLMDHGLSADTPAAVVRWGTTPQQQTLTGTVGTIAGRIERAEVTPPALIVIGQVVALRERLNWFERRPLFGRRVVVTRSRTQASALVAGLEALGAEAVEFPAIRIAPPADPAPLRAAVEGVGGFDWVVFTSANAVSAFFGALAEAGGDSRAFAGVRLCTIGPVTAARLGEFGLRPDVQPGEFLGAAVAEALSAAADLNGARVLYPRADIAPPAIREALTAAGAAVTDPVAYRTVGDQGDAEAMRRRLAAGEVHWITFTSSSTVKNFFAVVAPGAVRAAGVRLVSIGPSTSAALGELGLTPAVEADEHTIAGVIDAIVARESAAGDGRA